MVRSRALLLFWALGLAVSTASADVWPSRPITVVVPFPAGGGTDVVIRSLQPQLQRELGQPLVIENRAGAGGTLGSGVVAKAAPDGYTAGLATTSTHAVSVSVYRKLPYDPLADFEYAGFIGTSPYVLVAHPSVAAADLKSLLAELRKKGASPSFASVGTGTVSHLLGEQLKALAGVPLIHVPYRGAAPAYTDLIGGQVQMMFDNPVGLVPYMRAGRVKPIASTAQTALLTGVPTFAQQGVKGFDQTLWYGVVFPKGTPGAVVERFNLALNKVLSDRAVVADLAAKGVNAQPGSAAALRAAVVADIRYWGAATKALGVLPE